MKNLPVESPLTPWTFEVAKVAAPPPKLTVSQWADEHRVLSSEASSIPGRWRTSHAAYQRGIMDALSDLEIGVIVVMKSAQVGASEIELNMLGYHIAHDPAPILMLQPTLEMAEAFSKDRIAPMIRDCAQLSELVADPKSRDSANTLLHKQFPAGHLTLAGSNSPASLASRPIRIVLADEVDRYPISAGDEGDPLSLAIRRTATFWDRKIVMVSTPTVKNASRIEQAFKESDQRRYFVPCPHCAEMQTLVWGQVKWPEGKPEQAQYCCPHCASLWTEVERAAAVRLGEWRATAPFNGCAGFHISELYSPWSTLAKIAQDFAQAKEYPERLRTWVNGSLGESWEVAATATVEPHALSVRAEGYSLGTVPSGVGAVVAAVDVQGDRLEFYVWGFGEGEEAWVLNRVILWGDPAHQIVWDKLLELLDRPLTSVANSSPISPRVIAIDSGGLHTQTVYAFVKNNAVRRTPFGMQTLIAIKGQSSFDASILGSPSTVEVNWRGQKLAGGVKLWPIGVSSTKSLLYGRLKITTPGPGYIHFSAELPEDFYDQLTAERLVTKYVRGFGRLEWELTAGRRNEALDCFVYSYAAAVHMGMRNTRPADWTKVREQLHGAAVSLETAGNQQAPPSSNPGSDLVSNETIQPPAPPDQPNPMFHPGFGGRPGMPGSNWIKGWR